MAAPMNDLAEKALHGLDVARREVCARPMLSFAVLGFLTSSVVLVAGARARSARPARPLTTWLGLQDTHGAHQDAWVPGMIMVAAVLTLVLLWIAVVEFVRRSDQPERRVWWVAGAWALPFAAGPPLMDTTAYSYTAFGLVQRVGLSPYHVSANRLGNNAIVTAIDPGARGTLSGVGPLGTVVEHLAVSISSGNPLGAVIVLRVIAVLVAVVIGRLAADLAGARRSRALTLTILNPLLLLFVVSAEHLDGLMVALVLAAVSAANRRRWASAIVLGCLAGSVSGQGFVVLPAIITVHWLGRRTVAWWRVVARDVVLAGAAIAAVGFAVSDGFDWVSTVSKQFAAHTPLSAASAVAKVLSPVVRGASYDDLAAGARITVITAMVCAIGYLVATARHRALERTVGYSLLAMALLAPVLYPWYLLWGTLCLAPGVTGVRRIGLLALCAAGCVLMPMGFSPATTDVVASGAVTAVLASAVGFAALRQRARAPAEPVSAGS
jgi:alpha-1,6-mannosyltransferase